MKQAVDAVRLYDLCRLNLLLIKRRGAFILNRLFLIVLIPNSILLQNKIEFVMVLFNEGTR